ncbi:hypothetical protein K2173_025774 [Erythroxylum novogranatense]|uniref:Uncharacterized protein n=1 Tax=Erythroxylum novogranatense TaxID=1862640 RepID=A0AAV8SI45_9ROSI|nr:hypothetical protein K2173_025774 [Erythroxylum novogranatense]
MHSSAAQPETILEWLHKEMGYWPLGPSSTGKSQFPLIDSIRKIFRGSMIPVCSFLIKRVRCILLHGGGGERGDNSSSVNFERRSGRRKEKAASREEAERKRVLDERSKNRHKQAILEAYDQQCYGAAKIFREYHKRLCLYVNQARDAQRLTADYSTAEGNKFADDVILIETKRERNVRKACESLAANVIERIRNTFPVYKGAGILSSPQIEAAKLGIDVNGELTDDIKTVILNCLKNPPLLLEAILAYTLRLKSLMTREIEKIDVRADAETLSSCPAILATENAVNKAAEARDLSQKIVKQLHASGDIVSSHSLDVGGTLKTWVLEVWSKEREAAGLRASLNRSEIQHLNKLCKEEFDACRFELEAIYTALVKANLDAAAFWNRQPLAARKYASCIIIPVCAVVMDVANDAKDFIDKEVIAFFRSPDSSLYMLPATPQALTLIILWCFLSNKFYKALLESMGSNGSTGPEAISAAEKNVAILTARAGARDPSAIPSVCRVSAALQYQAGEFGGVRCWFSVNHESLDFCLKLRGSEASDREDLVNTVNPVHVRQELVEKKIVMEKWLAKLKNAVLSAKKCLEDCKYAMWLVSTCCYSKSL